MCPTASEQRLSGVSGGERVRIRDVPDDDLRGKLLRIGMLDGPVRCRAHVANGPVVVERNGTTLALGASVADDVIVAADAD